MLPFLKPILYNESLPISLVDCCNAHGKARESVQQLAQDTVEALNFGLVINMGLTETSTDELLVCAMQSSTL